MKTDVANNMVAIRAETDGLRPHPVSFYDKLFRCRKGTAMQAAKAGTLRAVFRKGRGGPQAWAFTADAADWFRRGIPTAKEEHHEH